MDAGMMDPPPGELERHQADLRRVWTENGLDPAELESMSIYTGGFTASEVLSVMAHPDPRPPMPTERNPHLGRVRRWKESRGWGT